MSDPALHHVTCPDASGSHQMAWWEWGAPDAAHLVVCVHGLSRQGRDFDVLAQALVARADHPLRVVCPDVAGRGRSDWLANPAGYQIPQYVADMLQMLSLLHARAPVHTLDWVGTSMGGLIGLGMTGALQQAAQAASSVSPAGVSPASPAAAFNALPALRRVVLNDVGPALEPQALARIGTYLGRTGRFTSVEEAADALGAIAASFGPHTREQWLALSRPMVRPLPEGGYTLHYDPAIAEPFRSFSAEAAAQGEALLWNLYDQLQAQTLLLRGAQSDLLSPATAQAMAARGPRARVVEFEGVGHAPTLVAPDQVDVVAGFLLAPAQP